MKLNLPLWAQIAANVLSLILALALGWKPELILFLFWAENVIIGIWQVPRLMLAETAASDELSDTAMTKKGGLSNFVGKLFFVGFFCFHYGLFTFVHGSFVFELFLNESLTENNLVKVLFSTPGLQLALLGIFASHAIQLLQDIVSGEATRAKRDAVMMSPYKRIVILHLVLLGSGFLLIQLPYPIIAVVLLFTIKISMDIAKERKIQKQQEAHVT